MSSAHPFRLESPSLRDLLQAVQSAAHLIERAVLFPAGWRPMIGGKEVGPPSDAPHLGFRLNGFSDVIFPPLQTDMILESKILDQLQITVHLAGPDESLG